MIRNELQYQLSKKWARKFKITLEAENNLPDDVDPIIFEASKQAITETLFELEQEITDYEKKEI